MSFKIQLKLADENDSERAPLENSTAKPTVRSPIQMKVQNSWWFALSFW